MKAPVLPVLVVLLAFAAAGARAETLTIDLSSNRVDITTGFNGTDIIVYGVKSGGGDVAVTLRGPDRTMVVRRKGQVAGAWINAQSVEFHRVPGYYDYAVTSPVDARIAQAHGIGLGALDFYHEERLADGDQRRFRDALIRNRQAQGLLPLQGRAVRAIERDFFKAVFPLPASVPSGQYRLEAFLIGENGVTARDARTMHVGQVGFSARIYLFAQQHALLYGLLAVVLAFGAGWGAFTFLRRD